MRAALRICCSSASLWHVLPCSMSTGAGDSLSGKPTESFQSVAEGVLSTISNSLDDSRLVDTESTKLVNAVRCQGGRGNTRVRALTDQPLLCGAVRSTVAETSGWLSSARQLTRW